MDELTNCDPNNGMLLRNNPKGNQSWIFIGRTDAEAKAPTLWPPDTKNWLIGKDPDAGKDWRREKGTREDKMVGGHHRLDGHEFEQALGVGDGQGSLACCSLWGHKESGMTEQLNWTDSVIKRTEFRLYSEGQGSLACRSSWGHKESDMTEWLNNNINNTNESQIHCTE